MEEWRQIFYHAMNMFNVLIVSYFFLANGTYTLLMIVSLVSVWLHNRRLGYLSLDELRESPVTPPATIIMPAWNEQDVIVESVRSILRTDYPNVDVIVVDDGSTDDSLKRLINAFRLIKMDLIYRPRLATKPIRGLYLNPRMPNLLVISKENGGKPDALNVGINICRTPYFCTLDADCILERDALLRLMRPIVKSPQNTVASGGIVRILNGCEVKDGKVIKVDLPKGAVERFQVVEYLRSFLFGRTGWNLLGGTLIVSGAFAVFHRETVIETGGFLHDTVTEDMDLIVQIHRWAVHHRRKIKMNFTSDPVCWTECPGNIPMLGRQRRRWQMGLCQTLWKSSEMLFNSQYGVVGLLSFPFHLYVEALGAVVEFLGYFMVPLALMFGMVPVPLFVLFVILSLVYGSFLSVGAVLLEELTYRRYPSFRDLMILLVYAVLENIGYRQIVLYYRVQGVFKFVLGFRQWEKVTHVGATP
ncbi:MAG: glycosyltransferase [Terriglobia bacterium]|jgi:cellulose synthase/poly-beta-1,6-N-acetylglucosamine synthase-like glycosyltransferase